jgi:hypothetical protein
MSAEQVSYRWRNDDGNETTATWKAAANTSTTTLIRNNVRLRILMDTVGTFSGTSVTANLMYRKTGQTGWFRVGDESAYSISYANIGAGSISTTTTVTPSLGAGTLGQSLYVMFIAQKPATANGGTVTTPTGWTYAGMVAGGGYGGTLAADTGNMNIFVYWKVADNPETSVPVTIGDNSVSLARVLTFTISTEATFSVAVVGGDDQTGDASFSATAGSDPGVIAGDMIVAVATVPTDAVTSWSAQALSQTGVTFSAVTEVADQSTASGNDMSVTAAYASATAGTSSGAPTFTATPAGTVTNARGPCAFIRIRGTAAPRCVMALSANIADGNSTAQMTPPGVKTTGDFTTGRIRETTPEAAVTIAADRYSEFEYCVQFTENALVGETYEYRLNDEGNVLTGVLFDTYSQTPQITISSGDLNAPQLFFMG